MKWVKNVRISFKKILVVDITNGSSQFVFKILISFCYLWMQFVIIIISNLTKIILKKM